MRRIFATLALYSVALNLFAAPPDVAGKWKWVYERDGQPMNIELDLKQDGSKLTGKITAPENRTMEIHDGKISEEGALSFYANLERDSGPLKINFSGKAAADKIDGKTEFTSDSGEKREHEWLAKRDSAHNLAGKWDSTFKRSDGTAMETTLNLKQEGSRLTGTQSFNDSQTEIRDGKVAGDEVTFRIVRDRDGRTVTSKYRGKIQKDNSLKGEIESDWTGEVRKLEWEAHKSK